MIQERIVLVDADGKPIGVADKLASHHAHTPLHLAFSCYIFNNAGELLVTRRALSKKVWPGVWTNSVCGHPAPGEAIVDAIVRRADYELGMQISDIVPLLPNYRYVTPVYKGIVENEICPVFIAKTVTQPLPNDSEVKSLKWLPWDDFYQQISTDQSDTWSWWCKDQARQMHALPLLHSYMDVSS